MDPDRQALTTIFAKRPSPGEVKTRLCPPLRPEQAADLALAMLDDTVRRELASGDQVTELAVAPASSLDWFRQRYGERLPVSPQVGDGLGARMASWFETRCRGAASVVIVGSDCPLLGGRTAGQAHAMLAGGADVVFVPDGGGGYSLVGLKRPASELFTEIPMSTRSMLDQTLEKAGSLGLEVDLLGQRGDVDEEPDLQRLDRELQRITMEGDGPRGADFPECTFEWLCREYRNQDEP